MEQSQEYQSAKKRAEARMGLYLHLAVYLTVIVFLGVIDVMTSAGTLWVHWPAMGWGLALALHAVFVLVVPGWFTVTDAMIAKEMGKSRHHS